MRVTNEVLNMIQVQCDRIGLPPTEDRESVCDEHVFDQMEHEQYAMYEWISRQIPEGAAVADIGCGPGIGAKILMDRGLAVTGLDISTRAEELTSSRGVPFVMGDPEDSMHINLPDRSYSYITCIEVIEHLQDPNPFLSDICRCGADDMTLFVSTPNRIYHTLFHRASETLSWDGGKCSNPTHWREWMPCESIPLLVRHFDHVEVISPKPDASHSVFTMSEEIVDVVKYGPTLMICRSPRRGG